RERLENLCRYLLRPPLADRRLRLLPADQVALELKSPWKDGTKWISMSADTFLERLASLVPRPRTHQVLYRG
ncbi:MAG: transposase, partial [Deltaproteobacteria bacterium]